ncbi:MAG: winged helix-turn-helix transcriptional regulator [Bauldia sp.]|nr:winged helix-turn-helix transcriptional regulator [Bauldia sp.]MCW5717620.1 winged helix-turn-helix transcriptional regulator [Bauldia sp.]MCW5929956.1 winged helix-turn-helix transcriptional regulator [Chitinophagaceae bacterium]
MEIVQLENRSEEASRLLTAMANRKRLLILCHLVNGELPVSELEGRVGLSQSALSQHLSKLRAWGLVEGDRNGQSVRYRLTSGPARKVIETLYNVYCEPAPPSRERRSARPSSAAARPPQAMKRPAG